MNYENLINKYGTLIIDKACKELDKNKRHCNNVEFIKLCEKLKCKK